jgi:glycosyltransferase involved in cell wall biosynthesis
LIYRPLIRRTRFVFTVSKDTQKIVVALYPQSESKVRVVGGGVTPRPLNKKLEDNPEKKFCLLVGGHIERKNLNFLLSFWQEIYLATGYELVSTSRDFNDKALTSYQGSRLRDLAWHSELRNVSEPDLETLYRGARFVLQPSIGEGFGLPLVEGMNFGTPFISSPVGIAAEVCAGESRVLALDKTTWVRYLIQTLPSAKGESERVLQNSLASLQSWEAVGDKIIQQLNDIRNEKLV